MSVAGVRPRITLVEQSGLHGYLDPRPSQEGPIGGAAWSSSEIRAIREEHGPDMLLMSGGDIFTGPDLSMKFDGKPVVDVMNHDGYDLWTLGNHDFDKGQEVLAELMKRAQFPVLAANLMDAASGRHVSQSDHILAEVEQYALEELAGAKVAVIGLMKEDTPEITYREFLEGLEFESCQATLKRLVPRLMEEHRPDCIVLHHQYLHHGEELAQLTRQLAGPDAPYVVVVGGHGYDEYRDPVAKEGTLLVQSTDRGAALNFLQLDYDQANRMVVGFEHDYLPVIPDELLPDEEVLALLERYREQLATEEEDLVLAVARGDFLRVKKTDGPIGSLVTDMMRQATGAEVAFLAGGTVKAPLWTGPIAKEHLREVLPFEDVLITIEMTGSEIRQALEESLDPAIGKGKVLQMSGLTVTHRNTEIVEVRLDDGGLLDPNKTYRCATDDFLIDGGDGFQAFTPGRNPESYGLVRGVVGEALMVAGTVQPVAAGTRLRELSL